MKKLLAVMALLISSAAWAGDIADANTAYEKKDYAKAIQKYKAAGIKGNAYAQTMVGSMYDLGKGVVQNDTEAVKWYKLAAAQGQAYAQSDLGVKYVKGQGIVQDYLRAHMWMNLAAVGGDARAVNNRGIIEKIMTHQQIVEAQKLARECRARNFKNCD